MSCIVQQNNRSVSAMFISLHPAITKHMNTEGLEHDHRAWSDGPCWAMQIHSKTHLCWSRALCHSERRNPLCCQSSLSKVFLLCPAMQNLMPIIYVWNHKCYDHNALFWDTTSRMTRKKRYLPFSGETLSAALWRSGRNFWRERGNSLLTSDKLGSLCV